MKHFNTAGTCFPDRHYMVDITKRISIIKSMIEKGDYFCINRGRQYGKTTTLEAVNRMLSDEYAVFQLSFEGLDDSAFTSLNTLCHAFFKLMRDAIEFEEVHNLSDEAKALIIENAESSNALNDTIDVTRVIPQICKKNGTPIIVIIDEVD